MNWLEAVISRWSSASSAVVVKGGDRYAFTAASVVRSPVGMGFSSVLLRIGSEKLPALSRQLSARDTAKTRRRQERQSGASAVHSLIADSFLSPIPDIRDRAEGDNEWFRAARLLV